MHAWISASSKLNLRDPITLKGLCFPIFFPYYGNSFFPYFGNYGLFQKKTKQGGLRIYFLKTPPEDFRFVTLPLEIPEKTSFHLEIQQNCVTSLRNSKVKNQNPWKFHMSFYLNTHGKSASFSIDPWNFYILFLQYPWKFHVLNPTCLVFFWNSPIWINASW